MNARYHSAAEIARMKLAGLPTTKVGISKVVKRENWPSRPRKGKGGGMEYELPVEARKQLAAKEFSARSTSVVPLPKRSQAIASMKIWQTRCMDARVAFVLEILALMAGYNITKGAAIDLFRSFIEEDSISPELSRLIPVANGRSNGERDISRSTLFNWMKDYQAGGIAALAPVAAKERPEPVWAAALLERYRRPHKPNITDVLDLWPEGESKPTYDQARYYLNSKGFIERNAGRFGRHEMKQFQAYVKRDTEGMEPGALFIADGHTFKAEVANPLHGYAYHPEIISVVDVATRLWVGWSAGMSESTHVVSDAIYHAVTTATCCNAYYYDNAKAVKNKAWDDELTGLARRIGITKHHSIPNTSQSRGIIERFHSAVLHKAARQLATYTGARMDPEAKKKVFKKVRKDLKKTGTSKLLISWNEFLDLIERARKIYNARPHRGLPTIIDPETGKKRHMSPNEAWAKAISEGWVPEPIPADEALDLFRPVEKRKVKRSSLISIGGNEYHSPALEHHEGEEVLVTYDLRDPSKVRIRQLDGPFICEAKWDGHKTSYFPKSVLEADREKRVVAMKRRLEVKMDRADAELRAPLIEHQPAPPMLTAVEPDPEPVPEKSSSETTEKIEAGLRPRFTDKFTWARWLIEHPDQVNDHDRNSLRRDLESRFFQKNRLFQEISIPALQALASNPSNEEAA